MYLSINDRIGHPFYAIGYPVESGPSYNLPNTELEWRHCKNFKIDDSYKPSRFYLKKRETYNSL